MSGPITPGPREPLAIIGMGCRFPGGVTSPESFWELLRDGRDATREVPENRWDRSTFYDSSPSKSGKTNSARGGFLDRIDLFDPQFFGISPREAMWLDPQQRMLLQVTWEAMEGAGLVPEQLSGSDTGVFVGAFTLDYLLLQNYGVYSRYELRSHSATGMMMTMLANRLSYVYGFRGPSMAVDTACSASLVAIHLACQALWNGECSLAVAGGASLMIVPTMTIAESKGGFLSPDGRCKTFDRSANGYARGEGAGVVLVKPLAAAVEAGDPIRSIIRGTAVTQDGHTGGITVPNGEAQAAAMRAAYRAAGVDPQTIQYVEAHGTGTPVGDPIEAGAIGSVVSQGRPDSRPCVVGSVKTNIGHLEAAAGVAGVIKTTLALEHRQIPAHLNFKDPNPAIPFEDLKLRVPSELQPWPETDGPRLAGVNSFGFGGTNAHVLLEGPPERDAASRAAEDGRPYLVTTSARSEEALRAAITRLAEFGRGEPADIADIAYTSTRKRSHHSHRFSTVATSAAGLATAIDAFLAGERRTLSNSGIAPTSGKPKLAFVCSGMGPQWWAMGRELLLQEPAFRHAVERCDANFQKLAGWSLVDEMLKPESESRMGETEVAQPTNFALQVGLAELFESWGVHPDGIVGHSAGEIASYYLSGALTLEDAVLVIYHRSRLQQRTTGQGRMLAVGMTPETLGQVVSDVGGEVSIAAINSPSAVTMVGTQELLDDMARQLETFHVFHRFLNGNVPYHSHYMESVREELLSSLQSLTPASARLPVYSTVTGTRVDGGAVDASYWWSNVRRTVLFSAAISSMIEDGFTNFLELSPHPVLASSIEELLTTQEASGSVITTLRRNEDARERALAALGGLYCVGTDVDWASVTPRRRLVSLPAYPWQLKPYWAESAEARADRTPTSEHPLLGQRASGPHPAWDLELSTSSLPFLEDHRVQNNLVLPGAAYIEMASAAACAVFGPSSLVDLRFRRALFLPDASDARLHTVLNPDEGSIEISSFSPTRDPGWMIHATARVAPATVEDAHPIDVAAAREAGSVSMTKEDFYKLTERMGFQYGAAFQPISDIARGHALVVGKLEPAPEIVDGLRDFRFHPAVLDAAFQALLVAPGAGGDEAATVPYLPVGVDRVTLYGPPAGQMYVTVHLLEANDRFVAGDARVVDAHGRILASLEGVRAQSLATALNASPDRAERMLYEVRWEEVAPPAAPTPAVDEERWLIFADGQGLAESMAQQLQALGRQATLIAHGKPKEMVGSQDRFMVDPTRPEQLASLFESLREQDYSKLLFLWPLDSPFPETGTVEVLERSTDVSVVGLAMTMRELARSGWERLPKVWIVTQRAQPVGLDREVRETLDVSQSPVWGIGRVIGHQEFGSAWGGLLDIDLDSRCEQAKRVIAEVVADDREDQIAYVDGHRHAARLVRPVDLTPSVPPVLRADASYLITGGLGSLGLLVAQWMIERGARRLVLMGRSPMPPREEWGSVGPDHPQAALIGKLLELERRGASLHLAQVDLTDEAQLEGFAGRYRAAGYAPIRGVVHAAGVVSDELLLRVEPDQLRRVLRPKVRGGWLLHEVFGKAGELDFFILFSSIGSVLASMGQSAYASGNAFLDGLAWYRKARGLPAQSIGWGPWSIGMVGRLHLEEHFAKRGLELITPEIGIQILDRLLGQAAPHVIALGADWATARAAYPGSELPAFFSTVGAAATSQENPESELGGSPPRERLLAMPAGDRAAEVDAQLTAALAAVMQLEPEKVETRRPLTDVGLDSLMAVEVKVQIEKRLGSDVSVLDLLKGLSLEQIRDQVLAGLPAVQAEPAAEEPAPETGGLDEIEAMLLQLSADEREALLADYEQPA